MTQLLKRKKKAPKSDQGDHHVSCSFSFPKSMKEEMDKRAERLRLSRTDYLKMLVINDLDKGGPIIREEKND